MNQEKSKDLSMNFLFKTIDEANEFKAGVVKEFQENKEVTTLAAILKIYDKIYGEVLITDSDYEFGWKTTPNISDPEEYKCIDPDYDYDCHYVIKIGNRGTLIETKNKGDQIKMENNTSYVKTPEEKKLLNIRNISSIIEHSIFRIRITSNDIIHNNCNTSLTEEQLSDILNKLRDIHDLIQPIQYTLSDSVSKGEDGIYIIEDDEEKDRWEK